MPRCSAMYRGGVVMNLEGCVAVVYKERTSTNGIQ